MGREAMDTLYELLSSERRRDVLITLTSAERPLARDELARRIVVRRQRLLRADVPNHPKTKKVEISLGHVHLPKLENGGLIDQTKDGRYDVTLLGQDVERAARAFKKALNGDDTNRLDGSGTNQLIDSGTWQSGKSSQLSINRRSGVPANDVDGDNC
ncbi:hypothetical protein GL213_01170 [Halogeometricum borinquense]|uniref:DUF7344 domain-containing protein n=2 Tax=Halogeometricum borinquense TaxID=60847 RepID=A0A6C0ULB7_9EURY|nr:hypothetical protein G3I44_19725 [Halogeometricum borinquense]QIQ75269.1 hypothetical protein GL213_01170 [Halogeometricum borinquense]